MILSEGVKVRFGADNSQLLSALRGNKAAVASFATAAVASLAGVTAASLKMSAQLDRDLRLVQTLGGEAASNVEGLRKEVHTLGIEFGKSFSNITRANYQAVSLGFKGIAESVKVTNAGIRLAIAGNGDLVASTATVGAALNSFEKDADEAGKVASQLFAIIRDGKFDAAELGQFLSDLPVTAAASGIQLQEIGAALSTITSKGTPASTAVDQLRSAIIHLEKEGFTGTLRDRIDHFAGQSLPQINRQITDLTAARGILALASDVNTFDANLTAAADTTGDFNAAVETMTNGPMAEWEELTARISSEMEQLGKNISEGVTPALRTMNTAFENFAKLRATLGLDHDDQEAIDAFLRRRDPYLGATRRSPVGAVNGPFYVAPHEGPFFPTPSGYDPFPLAQLPLLPDTLGGRGGRIASRRGGFRPDLEGGGTDISISPYSPESNPWAEAAEAASHAAPEFQRLGEEVTASSQFAAGAAGILAGTVGGALTAAFVTAESGAARFVQGLLAQFAQLGIQTAIGNIFNLPGFSAGGFTGASNGIVHPGEYVMPQHVVQSLGLGRMERLHAAGAAGHTTNVGGITLNVTGGGDAQATARLAADEVARTLRDIGYTGRDRLYQSSAQRYGGR